MGKLFNLKKSKNTVGDIGGNVKTEIKPDLNKYVDREGLTIKKLETGLWFVKNYKYFKYLYYGVLILISAITWPLFIYSFGAYVIKGMKDDNKLASDMVATVVSREAVLSQAAEPLRFGKLNTLKSNDNLYDFYIEATNGNEKHYAKFSYHIRIGNEKIGYGETFILPGEKKYILVLSAPLNNRPSDAEFYIDQINFKRIIPKPYGHWEIFKNERLDFTIEDKVFNPANASILSEKLSLNELSFSISNDTAYNFYEVDLVILLKGLNGIAAVSKYKVLDFYSGEHKIISATWPGSIGAVREIEIIPYVDITNENNYIDFAGGAGEMK